MAPRMAPKPPEDTDSIPPIFSGAPSPLSLAHLPRLRQSANSAQLPFPWAFEAATIEPESRLMGYCAGCQSATAPARLGLSSQGPGSVKLPVCNRPRATCVRAGVRRELLLFLSK